MIVVQDRIVLAPGDIARVQALFAERYRPAAAARGLCFIESCVSPPLALADQPSTLWLRWSLEHAGAFWAARSASGADPAVATFWADIDGIVHARERHFLVDGAAPLPEPQDLAPFRVEPQAWRETAQLYLHEDLSDAARSEFATLLADAARALPGLQSSQLGLNYVADYGAGHFTWDLLYPSRHVADAARASVVWQERILPALAGACRARCALGLETIGAGAREPALRTGVKRTALFRLLPGVSAAAVTRFELDTLEMPAHIDAIRNWRLSRALALDWDASGVRPWSYVWEQEYATLEGLTVDYMVHPHHWAHVDRSFDPESGAQIIDVALCHAFCALDAAFIAHRDTHDRF